MPDRSRSSRSFRECDPCDDGGARRRLGPIRGHVLDPGWTPASACSSARPGSGRRRSGGRSSRRRARGHRVLGVRGGGEWQLSLRARDLVAADSMASRDLPAPQRRLLRVLLLREDRDQPADPGALAVAVPRTHPGPAPPRTRFSSPSTTSSGSMPASAALLSLCPAPAARTERVGVLLARRDGPTHAADSRSPPPADGPLVVRLGPLTLGALGAVLRGTTWPSPSLEADAPPDPGGRRPATRCSRSSSRGS